MGPAESAFQTERRKLYPRKPPEPGGEAEATKPRRRQGSKNADQESGTRTRPHTTGHPIETRPSERP